MGRCVKETFPPNWGRGSKLTSEQVIGMPSGEQPQDLVSPWGVFVLVMRGL